MAGRMGSDRVTVKNLKIVKIDKDKNQFLISGAVPGSRGHCWKLEVKNNGNKYLQSKSGRSGKINLPENAFGLPWNSDLVHQVVVAMTGNRRTPVAHTKTRGEVSGGGRKPWRQKGLGKARHGSIRSPIWVGGGVAHGPRKDKDYSRKINAKAKKKRFLRCCLKN